jgi:hypothetical protein
MDQIITQAKRLHKIKMEKLTLAFLGKRADGIQDSQREISQDNQPGGLRDTGAEAGGPEDNRNARGN